MAIGCMIQPMWPKVIHVGWGDGWGLGGYMAGYHPRSQNCRDIFYMFGNTAYDPLP